MKPFTEKEFYKKRKAVKLHRCWEKLIIWNKTVYLIFTNVRVVINRAQSLHFNYCPAHVSYPINFIGKTNVRDNDYVGVG